MNKQEVVSWSAINNLLAALVVRITKMFYGEHSVTVYGIPRGGAVVAGLLNMKYGSTVFPGDRPAIFITDNPAEADLFIDDIICSGATQEKWQKEYDKPFFGLVEPLLPNYVEGTWFVFPWEQSAETDIEEHVTRILEFIGEDPTRDGLRDTPRRVVKSWREIYGGYKQDPLTILGTKFDSGYDEMVVLRDIAFYSMCEHHMLPFFGSVDIAYIPGPEGKVVGISKLARLINVFAQRLQIQENLTQQIAQTIQEVLNPKGVAVVIKAQHLCMKMRGVKNWSSEMVTSAMLGEFRDDPKTRSEFLNLTK